MKKLFILSISLLLLAACQKDKSLDNQVNRVTGGELLVKRVDKIGQDSVVTNYFYDANDRLTEEKTVSAITNSTGQVETVEFYSKYTRDETGKIIEVTFRSPNDDATPGYDTINTAVWYENNRLNVLGDSSIQYLYGVNNRVSKTNYYAYNGRKLISMYGDWTYDAAGNLIQIRFYKNDGNDNFSFNIGYDFEYDNQVNPLYSTDDDVLIAFRWGTTASPNNVVKQVTHYGYGAIPDDQNTIAYQYTNANVPAMAVFNSTAVAGTRLTTYYYQ